MSTQLLNKHAVRIGFIGLGLMGSRLTRRLHSSGWDVQAWNRSPGPASALRQGGIAIAASIEKLVADSEVILSCLANDEAVRSVYLGKGGVLSIVRPGSIVLEMSTISPELSRLLHQEASTRGIHLLDVAISGSTPAVEAGTITLLAGGDKSIFERCTPIYESIAKQWYFIGPGSSGIRMKLVVNLLLGVGMQAIAEAISLGQRLQIDRDVLVDTLSNTAVVAPAFRGKFEKIRQGDYRAQFPLRLMSKDMDLVMSAARALDADLPAASVSQGVLASNLTSSGDLDLSAITPYVMGQALKS